MKSDKTLQPEMKRKRMREQLSNLRTSDDEEKRKTLLLYWYFIAVCIVKCILKKS